MALSADEQRLLDQLEASLRAEDPALARKFDTQSARPPAGRRWLASGLCFLAGVALLVTGMLLSTFWLPVLGFLVMFTGVAIQLLRPRSLAKADEPSTDHIDGDWLKGR